MSALTPTLSSPGPDPVAALDATKCNVFHTSSAEPTLTPAPAATSIVQQGDPRRCTAASQTAAKALPQQQIHTWDANPDHPLPDNASIFAAVGFNDLSEKQVQALDLLFSGMRLSQITTVLEINRTTLHRWRTQHPAFIAAYNRRHREALDAVSIRVGHLLDESLQQFEAIFAGEKTKPRRLKAASLVLRTFASRKLLQPAGPTNPPAVLRHLALQRRAESCDPLTRPLSQEELNRVLDELQYELRDIVLNKYSHATALPTPAAPVVPSPLGEG